MLISLDKKYQRECCISSGSDSTFMHLYYKKCASSSKLTVLSKVLQLQLGICLSGLALFTGWWFLFLVFLAGEGCLFLPGGPSGVFFCGVWWWRREFFWVLFWILVTRKAGNLPACYSVILKHDASDLEHRRCWKIFWGGLEISTYVFKEGLVSLKNHPVNNRVRCCYLSSHKGSLTQRHHTRKVAIMILKFMLCSLISKRVLKGICLWVGLLYKVTSTYVHCLEYGMQMFEQAVFPYLHCPVFFCFSYFPEYAWTYVYKPTIAWPCLRMFPIP